MGTQTGLCTHCVALEARLAQAEAHLAQAEQVIAQMLCQTRIAMGNQAVAERTLIEYLHPDPEARLAV